jgi:hypothetical protein
MTETVIGKTFNRSRKADGFQVGSPKFWPPMSQNGILKKPLMCFGKFQSTIHSNHIAVIAATLKSARLADNVSSFIECGAQKLMISDRTTVEISCSWEYPKIHVCKSL